MARNRCVWGYMLSNSIASGVNAPVQVGLLTCLFNYQHVAVVASVTCKQGVLVELTLASYWSSSAGYRPTV